MASGTKPRNGSMAFYPRVKAKSIVPKFNTFGDFSDQKECKLLCYYGVKVGMTHIIAKDAHKNSSSYGQEVAVPVSIIETPSLKVIGARLYKSNSSISGKKSIYEFLVRDHLLSKRITGNKSKDKSNPVDDLLKKKDEADDLVLLCALDLKATTTGQKKPVVFEIILSGTFEEKINYFKDKFNKSILISEMTKPDTYLDVKSITKGHGFTGPVKRFGIKVQRPKCQQHQRHVGSIGPWHPATVMFTVARAGQHGFHNRTTFNKKLISIETDPTKVNRKGGFGNYGVVKNSCVLVAGTIPGPAKRIVALRNAIRPTRKMTEVVDVSYIAR